MERDDSEYEESRYASLRRVRRDRERSRNVCERRTRYVERKGVITQETEQNKRCVIGDVQREDQLSRAGGIVCFKYMSVPMGALVEAVTTE